MAAMTPIGQVKANIQLLKIVSSGGLEKGEIFKPDIKVPAAIISNPLTSQIRIKVSIT